MTNKLLTIVISYFNRFENLKLFYSNWLKIADMYKDKVEIFILDNQSLPNKSAIRILDYFEAHENIKIITNFCNIGMLGNLNVASYLGNSEYIWLIGDDDYVDVEKFEIIISSISEKKYDVYNLNYDLSTHEIKTESDLKSFISGKMELKFFDEDKHGNAIQLAGVTENFYTGIYSVILRRNLAVSAYNYFGDDLFLSLKSCVPVTNFILANSESSLTAHFVSEKIIIANSHTSWGNNFIVWALGRIPEIHLNFLAKGTSARMVNYWILNHEKTFSLGLDKLKELDELTRLRLLDNFRIDYSNIRIYSEKINILKNN